MERNRIRIICFPKCSIDEISRVRDTLESQLDIDKSLVTHENIGKLPPAIMINPARNQYISEKILEYIASIYSDRSIVVAIVKYDAYAYYYNFVFGHADPINRVCAVYTPRLESGNRAVYLDRLSKEVLHEVGHVLGLHHCSDRKCVMNFSNNILDVDRKSATFCERCRSLLKTGKLEGYR